MIPPEFLCDLIRWKEVRDSALGFAGAVVLFLPNGSEIPRIYNPVTAEFIMTLADMEKHYRVTRK